MIGPHRVSSSETRRTPCYMLVYHSYIVPIPRYVLDIARYGPDLPQYEIKRHQTTSNYFALRYTHLAPVIMVSCTSPIHSRVIATHDEHFEHSMRMIFAISNSIRCFFFRHLHDIRMVYSGIVGQIYDVG